MRNIALFSLIAIIFSGCSVFAPQAPEAKVEKCESPFAYISTPEINLGENELEVSIEDIKKFFEQSMNRDSCLALSENPDAYSFNINVSSYMNYQNKEGIATDNQEATAGIKVSFMLKKDRSTTQFNSEQSLKISGKKVLGIGKGAKISNADKEEMLQRAIQKAYDQVLNTLR